MPILAVLLPKRDCMCKYLYFAHFCPPHSGCFVNILWVTARMSTYGALTKQIYIVGLYTYWKKSHLRNSLNIYSRTLQLVQKITFKKSACI